MPTPSPHALLQGRMALSPASVAAVFRGTGCGSLAHRRPQRQAPHRPRWRRLRLPMARASTVSLVLLLFRGAPLLCASRGTVAPPAASAAFAFASSAASAFITSSRRSARAKVAAVAPLAASSTRRSGSDPSVSSETSRWAQQRTTPSEEERPTYPRNRRAESAAVAAASAALSQRPGAIIETEEQLEAKARILREMGEGKMTFTNSEWLQEVYGEEMVGLDDEEDEMGIEDDEDEAGAAKDIDAVKDGGENGDNDDQLLDANTLGKWTIEDIRSKFDYEWDPNGSDPDPNLVSLNRPSVRYVEEAPQDPHDAGVELGYDPIFGPSSPVDRRTILGAKDSYMVDPSTRDEKRLQPQFARNDPELDFNREVVEVRQAMDIMETFIDPFLPDMEIPRHVAKWHGYPDMQYFEPKPFTNNRFTADADRTDFDKLDPHRARQKAVELARAKNAEWLPPGVSQTFHESQRAPYEAYQTLVGTLRKQSEPFDEDLLEQIQPALQVFGACVELLSVQDGVFRFHYHGLMKNRHGMTAWMESLLRDECGVDPVTGVVMETGFRQRDAAYDGGDKWYAPIG